MARDRDSLCCWNASDSMWNFILSAILRLDVTTDFLTVAQGNLTTLVKPQLTWITGNFLTCVDPDSNPPTVEVDLNFSTLSEVLNWTAFCFFLNHSCRYFLEKGYAVIFLHRCRSLQPYSRHFSRVSFLDILELKQNEGATANIHGKQQKKGIKWSVTISTKLTYLKIVRDQTSQNLP